MLFIFHIYLSHSHWIITVGKIYVGPQYAIRVSFAENNFSEKLILGPNNYDLNDQIIFHGIILKKNNLIIAPGLAFFPQPELSQGQFSPKVEVHQVVSLT